MVADALQKVQAQAAEEQAIRDAAKAEYEAELARVSLPSPPPPPSPRLSLPFIALFASGEQFRLAGTNVIPSSAM